MYRIVLRKRFERAFADLDKETQRIIVGALERLAVDPFASPNVKRISGVRESAYRLRVGRWRVLYFLISKEKTIEVIELFLKTSDKDYRRFVTQQ